MNEAQRIAFMMAQITACQCKYQGMVTANIQASVTRRPHEPIVLPYQQKDFEDLIDEFGLGYNYAHVFLVGDHRS